MADELDDLKNLTPSRIVAELDKFIIGQDNAKRAVAIALRNRWRRMQVEEPLRSEITPKNILMIGPTGVGKTEISRRLAKLVNAPFIKVEATKFTEVGYVGRDVDSIIRDLTEIAVEDTREEFGEEVRDRAEDAAEDRILDALLPGAERDGEGSSDTRQKFRKMLREGELDEREIDIEVSAAFAQPIEGVMMPPGFEEIAGQFQQMFQQLRGEQKKKRRMIVGAAYELLVEEETSNLVDHNEIKEVALDRVEDNGIVFIDEVDKIAGHNGSDRDAGGPDISRHGVQRDLLPLIEGTNVSTRYGNVRTEHILFIASGAFHYSRPSDLIPELQGRFPLRVELKPLTVMDFEQILTNTSACLTRQYQALLATEEVKVEFTPDGVRTIAETAWRINEQSENIGARRLYTIMEKLLDDTSFRADELKGKTFSVSSEFVNQKLGELAENRELARYVL